MSSPKTILIKVDKHEQVRLTYKEILLIGELFKDDIRCIKVVSNGDEWFYNLRIW